MGDVSGLFVSTREELATAYGKHVYFGEILGKHSEVSGTLEENEFEILSEDQDFIDKLVALLGTSISGYNPFDYNIEFGEDEEE